MKTVGTRELKQNPQAVVRSVLDGGEPVEVTSHGNPTGVSLVPDRPGPQRWVKGAVLMQLPAMSAENVDNLRRQLDDLYAEDDEPRDPWEKQ